MTDEQQFAEVPKDQTTDAMSQHDVDRRMILKRLGALAALTPPAVVTMLTTASPAAAS